MKTCPVCRLEYPNEYSLCPRDQNVLVVASEVEPRSVIRRKYLIIGELGQDGMSIYYRARHLILDCEVLLRMARTELMQQPKLLQRFSKEAERYRELESIGGPSLLDIDESEQGILFFVLTSVDGEKLRKLLGSSDASAPSLPSDRSAVLDRHEKDDEEEDSTSGGRHVWLLAGSALAIILVVAVVLLPRFNGSPATGGLAPVETAVSKVPDKSAVVNPSPEPPVAVVADSRTVEPPAVVSPPPSEVTNGQPRAASPLRTQSAAVPEAQVRLGRMYETGAGVPVDELEAARWYRRAAEKGYAPGQSSLGDLYENGRGISKDYVQAVAWYQKAAVQGFAPAQNSLANAYALGKGVPRNDGRALAWYRKAAAQGHVVAQANLGWVYETGRGVKSNPTEAASWYRRAAEHGYAPAQSNLADLYVRSSGVANAVVWYRKAAEQGYAPAQSRLGTLYENGEGVDKDLDSAVAWYRKAAKQGYDDARRALQRLGVPAADL